MSTLPRQFDLQTGVAGGARGRVREGREPHHPAAGRELSRDVAHDLTQHARGTSRTQHAASHRRVGQRQREPRNAVIARVGLLQLHAGHARPLGVFARRGQRSHIEIGAMKLAQGSEPRALDQLDAAAGEWIPDHVVVAHAGNARERCR